MAGSFATPQLSSVGAYPLDTQLRVAAGLPVAGQAIVASTAAPSVVSVVGSELRAGSGDLARQVPATVEEPVPMMHVREADKVGQCLEQ